ncbi:MAG: flavin reductase family protein [Novosphingobium sp.]|nr:flavin reductase family protein [Novosphingobium sp.]
MQFDMRELGLAERYKLMNSTITPRPIAWVTTRSKTGLVNAAPYSFFNACGVEPPLVVLGLLKDFRTRERKDTATNIVETGEFVVNLVCEKDAETMNLSSVDAPRDVSEIDYAGIETAPSIVVAPPRIATSPVNLECRRLEALDIGVLQTVVIGEVVAMHVADEFIADFEKLYLDTPAMKLIGRTHGAGWYARTTDQFMLERPRYDPERGDRAREGQDQ